MATSGDLNWPPVDTFSWPRTLAHATRVSISLNLTLSNPLRGFTLQDSRRDSLRLADVWLKNACMPIRAKLGRKRKLGVVKYADVILSVDRKELLTT